MPTHTLTDPITVVPSGIYRAKFDLRWMVCSSRPNRASEIHYSLEITSATYRGRKYSVNDSWLTIDRQEPRLHNELVEIFGDEIDGLLDEDGTVDMDLLIGKEVEITVDNYVNTRGSVGPRHWFKVSFVDSIRRAEPLKPQISQVQKQSPPTRSKVRRKNQFGPLDRGAFTQMYPGMLAV